MVGETSSWESVSKTSDFEEEISLGQRKSKGIDMIQPRLRVMADLSLELRNGSRYNVFHGKREKLETFNL